MPEKSSTFVPKNVVKILTALFVQPSKNTTTMATKFTMIAPFDQASGNVSGKQLLKYALNNNPAYDSPVGRVNYARNYRTRYVAGIRSATGEGYIQVKKRAAVHLTQRAKLNMALLGATGAMYADIVRNKSTELYQNLYAQWLELQNLGNRKTFRQSISDAIRAGLQQKLAEIPYAGPRGVVNITNPWVYTGLTPNVTVGTDILVKFWGELAQNGIYFTVAGNTGIAKSGMKFVDIIAGASSINILGLSTEPGPEEQQEIVMQGDLYLLKDNEYVLGTDDAVGTFFLTSVAPA